MRTTVTLDPDVAARLKEYSHRKRISFKKALNELVRRGLQARGGAERRKRFRVVAHHGGFQPGIDPNRLNQLVDQLEVAEFLRGSRETR